MSYLEDYEKRILFSALAREKKVCKTIDRLEPPKGTPLVKIVESLERKFYYNRFEKEIRNKAIDEFAEKVCDKVSEWSERCTFPKGVTCDILTLDCVTDVVFEVAEELKGVQEC